MCCYDLRFVFGNWRFTINMKTKKGFLTVGMLVVGAIILLIFFGGFAFLTWILSRSIPRLVGSALLILVTISFIWGKFKIPQKVAIAMLVIGGILVLLPLFSDFMNIPLAAVLP